MEFQRCRLFLNIHSTYTQIYLDAFRYFQTCDTQFINALFSERKPAVHDLYIRCVQVVHAVCTMCTKAFVHIVHNN